MPLPATEQETLAPFPPVDRIRIDEILSQGRVLLVPAAGGLEAKVAGNRPTPYGLRIEAGAEDWGRSRCDCGGPAPCVHLAAAWIHHLRRSAPALDAAGFSRQLTQRLARQLEGGDRGAAVPAERRSGASPGDSPLAAPDPEPEAPAAAAAPTARGRAAAEIAGLFASPGAPAAGAGNAAAGGGERWSLGFRLEIEQRPLPAQDGGRFRRVHVVRPCLVYRRRDGGAGRTKEFRREELSEAPPPAEAAWLEAMLARGGRMELESLLLAGAAPGGPALPTLRDEQGHVVAPEAVESVLVRCLPRAQAWGAAEYDYRAELVARGPNGEFAVRGHENGIDRIMLSGEGGRLGLLSTEPRLAALLDYLAGRRMQLDAETIAALREEAARNPLPGLAVESAGLDLRRCLCRGLAVLRLEPSSRGAWANDRSASYLRLEVDWDFKDCRPDPEPEGDWLRCVGAAPDGGRAMLWVRDLDWEEAALDWLRAYLGGLVADDGGEDDDAPVRVDGRFHARPDAQGQLGRLRRLDRRRAFRVDCGLFEFLRGHGRALMEAGFAFQLPRDAGPSRKGSVKIDFDQGMDWLDIEAFVETMPRGRGGPGARRRAARKAKAAALGGERRAELSAVQDLLDAGLARSDQGLVLLEPGDVDRLRRLLELGLAGGGRRRVAAGDLATLSALAGEAGQLRLVERARRIADDLARVDLELREEPAAGFGARLRGYQSRGYNWMLSMHRAGLGACLADDMGLGKTVQALALLHRLADAEGPGFKALVVAPVSTLPNWQREIERFAPGLAVYLHHGADRGKASADDFERALAGRQVALVSYATARNDRELLAGRRWRVVVADEAQALKNPLTQTFEALAGLAADQRISLTGTPVENGTRDLWSHMEFVNPGALGSLKRFESRFAAAIEERRDAQALDTLRRVVAPFLLRRRKADVAAELPPKQETVVYCDLGPEQRRVYDDVKDAYLLKIEDAERRGQSAHTALTVLEALLRLRQACLFPGILSPEWADLPSAKQEVLEDLLDRAAAEGLKTLVFSQFTAALDRIQAALGKAAPLRLDGSTADRAEPVRSFQEDPERRVFLVGLKAGGVGINLTAADFVVLFDPWWNPAVENQAIDRAHRIGRDRPVAVYRLIARDTVEEKMLALQERKRHLADSLTGLDDAGLLARLSPAEMKQLLG